MISYFIRRPVAVIMIFASLTIAGLGMTGYIPVSLLPSIDVPRIVVRLNYPDMPAPQMEEEIMQPVRDNLGNLDHLQSIECRSANHTGLVTLTFYHGTRMDLAYIAVTEKLDRMASAFPRDMEPPQIMRVNTSDIPVIRLQIIPRKGTDYVEASGLVEKVLKRRMEQLEGVSMIDLNGIRRRMISIVPDEDALNAFGLRKETLAQSIQRADSDPGGLVLKEGPSRYLVQFEQVLKGIESIRQLPVKTRGGIIVPLNKLASVTEREEQPLGYHLFNGKEAIVLTVQKQSSSRLDKLVPAVRQMVTQFRKDYPQLEFELTQDQTYLLNAGIDNLYQDLIYGGILTIMLLFLFLGNWAAPTLMSISIPLSLYITFVFFKLFGISFNIISLSGLALGIGMLIDNSIVVINNINRKRSQAVPVQESCDKGTTEVITPVISQVLTTVAVYIPLVLLNGMAGDLVYDQSIALTISLGISLLIAFVLSPVLYNLFLGKRQGAGKEDTMLYKWIASGYHRMLHHILQYRRTYLGITLMLMLPGFWIAVKMPVSSLPEMEKTESLLVVDWNEPIDAAENLRRTKELQQVLQPLCSVTEAETGIRQFLLQQDDNPVRKAEVYLNTPDEQARQLVNEKARTWMRSRYPAARLDIRDAPNAFTQLFQDNAPYFEARFRTSEDTGIKLPELHEMLKAVSARHYVPGENLVMDPCMSVVLDHHKMLLYGVQKSEVELALQHLFGAYRITAVKGDQRIDNVRLDAGESQLEDKLGSMVTGAGGIKYPIRTFATITYGQQQRCVTADKGGVYWSVAWDREYGDIDVDKLREAIQASAQENNMMVSFNGQYFDSRDQVGQLFIIFLVVLAFLYFILALQYGDLLLPVLVMLTIPLGITGSMFLLWICGYTLNVMAAIGFVVVLGLIVDDPILKLETLVRLKKQYAAEGVVADKALLERIIHEAGDRCLKPLLMVSLTTSIAMVPVLLIGGIGNDLQRPLAIVIIGGLTIGTFFTTWFIPLAYWYLTRWRKK